MKSALIGILLVSSSGVSAQNGSGLFDELEIFSKHFTSIETIGYIAETEGDQILLIALSRDLMEAKAKEAEVFYSDLSSQICGQSRIGSAHDIVATMLDIERQYERRLDLVSEHLVSNLSQAAQHRLEQILVNEIQPNLSTNPMPWAALVEERPNQIQRNILRVCDRRHWNTLTNSEALETGDFAIKGEGR